MFTNNRFEHWKRDKYPKYWIQKVREYGLDYYCKGLIVLIEDMHPKSAFELAIGTGYPFCERLVRSGIDVAGCDISHELIAQVKKEFPALTACVGGYEDLDDIKRVVTQRFDLIYSLRSTWYFADIASAIDFMLYFARPGGVVVFDIMNRDSNWNKRMLTKKNRLFLITILKNMIKSVVNWVIPNRYMIDTVFGSRDIMYSPSEIEAILNDRGVSYKTLNLAQIETLGGRSETTDGSFSPDQKLVYVVHKCDVAN